jgi:hypothetical protein
MVGGAKKESPRHDQRCEFGMQTNIRFVWGIL